MLHLSGLKHEWMVLNQSQQTIKAVELDKRHACLHGQVDRNTRFLKTCRHRQKHTHSRTHTQAPALFECDETISPC